MSLLPKLTGWSRGIRPAIMPPIYSDKSRAGGIGAGCPNFRLHRISVSAWLRRDGLARQGGCSGFSSKGSARAPRAVRRAPASNVFPRCSRRGVANHTRGACAPPSGASRPESTFARWTQPLASAAKWCFSAPWRLPSSRCLDATSGGSIPSAHGSQSSSVSRYQAGTTPRTRGRNSRENRSTHRPSVSR